MASYASQKYEEIVTYDNDKQNILRTLALFLSEKEWDLTHATVQKLLYVRNTILKGGAGLAAPQIGISHPIFIYTPDRTTESLRAVINPIYAPVGEETIETHEACFSIPLRCTHLKRWKKIKVSYQNLEGQKIDEVLEGFAANAFQHEMDHIRGILTIDHENANVKTFTDPEAFKSYMKQIHLEDSKSYPKDACVTSLK